MFYLFPFCDEFDLKSIMKYEKDITNTTLKTYSHEDVKKM